MTSDQDCIRQQSMTMRITEDTDNYKGHCTNFKHQFSP